MSGRTAFQSQRAFTLVELLIVVTIMAILAARAVPNMIDATTDAKMSAMQSDEAALRNAIQRYRAEHRGDSPNIVAGTLPQLTSSTNATGTIGTGRNYPYGPYLNEIPGNALNGYATVTANTGNPPVLTNKVGWQYNQSAGRIWGGLRVLATVGGGGGS